MIRFASLGEGRHELWTETVLPLPVADVFPFFADAGNLQRITPPELGFRILTSTSVELREGARIEYRLRLFGIPFGWRTRISGWSPPHSFTDEQEAGPYHTWVHTHAFESVEGGTRMTDRVVFRLPLGRLGALALPLVRLQLRRIFEYRARAIRATILEGSPAG